MAGPTTTPNGQIVPKAEPSNPDKMAALIQKMTPELSRALPKHLTGDRMARIATTAIRVNPQLAECTQISFIGCLLSCAMLGLEPNTPLGFAYLIPRKNKKNQGKLECTLQLGYQGMIELTNRAGANVFAYVVRQGDDFHVQLGTDPLIHHEPSAESGRQQRPITHAYAVAVAPDGRKTFTVLSKEELDLRRARSATPAEGPWVTDEEAMCLKTAVRAHFRWMPKSTEKTEAIARGVAIEEASETGTPLLAAFDPAVTSALEKHGLEESESIQTEGTQAS